MVSIKKFNYFFRNSATSDQLIGSWKLCTGGSDSGSRVEGLGLKSFKALSEGVKVIINTLPPFLTLV